MVKRYSQKNPQFGDKNKKYLITKKAPHIMWSFNFMFDFLLVYYFLMTASIAANHASSLSLVRIYNSSPGLPLKKVTAA